MWMFESAGFYSIVAYDPSKDKFKDSQHKEIAEASDDPKGGFLLIRARMIEDLEVMEEIVGHSIYIQTDRYADYSFRALMSRDQFKAYLALTVDRITYGAHFKEASRDETAKKSVSNANRKYSAMMSIWSIMANLQPYVPYSGAERSAPKTVSNKGWSGTTTSDSSTVTSVTTSGGTTYYGNESPEYRSDEFYDSLFSGHDSARENFSGWGESLPHDGEDDDWYNYAGVPAGNAPALLTAAPAANHVPAVSAEEKSFFTPSNYWFTLQDLAKHLWQGGTLSSLTDRDIDSMPEEVWELWVQAVKSNNPNSVYTKDEVEALCGEGILAEISEEGETNEQD